MYGANRTINQPKTTAECSELNLVYLEGKRNFSQTYFSLNVYENIDFNNCIFYQAVFKEIVFKNCNFKNCTFNQARFSNVTFAQCTLSKCNFKNLAKSRVAFRESDLSDSKFDYQIESGLLQKLANVIIFKPGCLSMRTWHTCKTVKCLAGWAVTLSKEGKALEEKYGSDLAGLLLLGAEAQSYFYQNESVVLDYLKNVIGNVANVK